METVIKTVQGECGYITTQEFGSVEDAHNDHNPLTDQKCEILDTKIINTKYKLKKDENRKDNDDSVTTPNNTTDSPLLR